MKLTKNSIDTIYWFISVWFSQRATAEQLEHSRGTIARYLKPKVMAEHIRDQYHKIADIEYEMYVLKNKVSLWRYIAIVSFIGFIAQALINFFY